MTDISSLYCDGGVIGRNPSEIGGTWAFCEVVDAGRLREASGIIAPAQAELPTITNNLTEMLALVRALQSVPATWHGTVYSDSQITLGRAFMGWQWKNIPRWLHHEFQRERARLVNWGAIKWVLLKGHPTRAELAAGESSCGCTVSEHNVWCDKAYGERGVEYGKLVGFYK